MHKYTYSDVVFVLLPADKYMRAKGKMQSILLHVAVVAAAGKV